MLLKAGKMPQLANKVQSPEFDFLNLCENGGGDPVPQAVPDHQGARTYPKQKW